MRIQQSAVLLPHRSDAQVRVAAAADYEAVRTFSIVYSEPHWGSWSVRRHLRSHLYPSSCRRKGSHGSIDRTFGKRENLWLVELQQRSSGVFVRARLVELEDNWFLEGAVDLGDLIRRL